MVIMAMDFKNLIITKNSVLFHMHYVLNLNVFIPFAVVRSVFDAAIFCLLFDLGPSYVLTHSHTVAFLSRSEEQYLKASFDSYYVYFYQH